MKKIILITTAVVIILSGCSGQYKTVKRTEFLTKSTKKGEVIEIKKQNYPATKDTEERMTNVIPSRMTDFRGKKEPGAFSVSYTNDEIVFECFEKSGNASISNLMKVTVGTEAVKRLTSGNYMDMEPCYSKDGSELFFSSNRNNETANLFKIKSNGLGGITAITQNQSHDRFPHCSEESDNLIYMSIPINSNQWEIYSVNYSGQLPTQLVNGFFPRVSPDGKKIVYSALDNRGKNTKIWVMNSDGTDKRQLTQTKDSNDLYPSWSSDNNRIVYCSDHGRDIKGKRNFDIWMLSLDGSVKPKRLTTNGSTDLMPQFSRDGKFIYCLSNRGFSWEIWRLEITGE